MRMKDPFGIGSLAPMCVLLTVACGSTPQAVTARPTSDAPPRRDTTSNPETPLTPATLTFASNLVRQRSLPQRRYVADTVFPIPYPIEGGVGFLDASGSRTIATLSEVRHLKEQERLASLCVAKDGKFTLATTVAQGGTSGEVWVADSFDGTLRSIGTPITSSYTSQATSVAWLVRGANGAAVIADCESGTIEPLGVPVTSASLHTWSPELRVVRVTAPLSACFVKTPSDKTWVRVGECMEKPRVDRSTEISLIRRDGKKSRYECAFVIAEDGTKQACNTPVGPTKPYRPPTANPISIATARYYASGLAVMPNEKGNLVLVSQSGVVDEASGIVPHLSRCEPLHPALPLFDCDGDGVEVVVSVDANGKPHEEWRRPSSVQPNTTWLAKSTFHASADGSLAVGGHCDGTLGDAACVRRSNGTWETVRFSDQLVSALTRTAPSTRLFPTVDGKLFAGTGSFDTTRRDVSLNLFDAEKGSPVAYDNVPIWVLGALSSVPGSRFGAFPQTSPQFFWASPNELRAWPLERQHPAFHTKEACGITFQRGTFTTDCLQGKLSAVGRMGLWAKKPGEIFETLDAGVSWNAVALPKGVDTDDIACVALGCRIGPYWRMGWGHGSTPQR